MLILVTAVPAPLLAQTQGGSGFPSLGGVGGVGSGSKDTLPAVSYTHLTLPTNREV